MIAARPARGREERAPAGRAGWIVEARALAAGLALIASLGAARAQQPQQGAPQQGAPQQGEAAPVDTRVPAEAFATVDGVPILRAAVKADAARLRAPLQVVLQRSVSAQLIRARLVQAGADPALVTEAELEQGLIEARNALTARGAPPEALAQLAGMREELRVPVAFSRFISAQVSDEELARDFEARKVFVAGEVRARQLVVRIDPAKGGEPGAKERLAALQQRLGATPTEDAFAALARSSSEDPSAALTGGDLDWVSAGRPGSAPRPVVTAALEHGQTGLRPAPVVGPRSLHLVFVAAVRVPRDATLDRLLPRMREEAKARKAAETMDRWLNEATILYAPDAPR